VSVGGLLALDQVLKILGQVFILGLRQPVEGRAQVEVKIVGSQPLFRDFGFWAYVTGMGCRPVGLPMFRPFCKSINRCLGDVSKSRSSKDLSSCNDVMLSASGSCKCFVHSVLRTCRAKCK
jgi:hypothetical protein